MGIHNLQLLTNLFLTVQLIAGILFHSYQNIAGIFLHVWLEPKELANVQYSKNIWQSAKWVSCQQFLEYFEE